MSLSPGSDNAHFQCANPEHNHMAEHRPSWWDFPREIREWLEKHGYGPGVRLRKAGGRGFSDEVLFCEYRQLRERGFGRLAAFREHVALRGGSFSTIRRRIRRHEATGA